MHVNNNQQQLLINARNNNNFPDVIQGYVRYVLEKVTDQTILMVQSLRYFTQFACSVSPISIQIQTQKMCQSKESMEAMMARLAGCEE